MGSGVAEELFEAVKVIFRDIQKGSVVSIMVRGYKPEGEIYRVLFFVTDVENYGQATKGVYGVYEEELDRAPARFIKLEDILALEIVAGKFSNASYKIRELVLERNSLREKIRRQNEFVKKNLLIVVE